MYPSLGASTVTREQPENNKSMGFRTPISLSRKLPFDHDPEADSVLGRGGNKRGPHIYNKQHGRIHDKVTMNNMNMHGMVLDSRPISSDKDIIENIIT